MKPEPAKKAIDRGAYVSPRLVLLGTLAEVTRTGISSGKEGGSNPKLPITLSNP